jgi:5-methylcytosine-specific restriction enzyme subunit McrC
MTLKPELFLLTKEHKEVPLTVEELLVLSTELPKLVDKIDISRKLFATGYYVGLSWIVNKTRILSVQPKLDDEGLVSIDYLKMFASALRHPEILASDQPFFGIQFDEPSITIRRQDDLLTPLLIVYFLQLMNSVVRKGIPKSYYAVKPNLKGRVKGKVMVSQTVKENVFRNRDLYTRCQYEEFGVNSIQNRLIRKALTAASQLLKSSGMSDEKLDNVIRLSFNALHEVGDEVSFTDIMSVRPESFFPDYTRALETAKLILRRSSYSSVSAKNLVVSPPYWIDMSKIFELYVLGKLKDCLGPNEVQFQAKGKYGATDFLRITKGSEMIIDAKYKPWYSDPSSYDPDDIRQLSAYARDRGVLARLSIDKRDWPNTMLDCLIIYPDQSCADTLDAARLKKTEVEQFERFYKIGIALPEAPSI